jgi:hypothetical protein
MDDGLYAHTDKQKHKQIKMKVLGYVMLHYGVDYLEYALTPLCEVCEKVIILYSLNPTHNMKDKKVSMDSRGELQAIAGKFPNVQWIDVFDCVTEGQHRDKIFNYTKGYDVLVNADYDEVWNVEDLRRAVVQVYNSPFRNHGIDGFINFWRGFGYVAAKHKILDYNSGKFTEGEESDLFRPIRLIHLREKNVSEQPDIKATIYHFGYVIKRRKMEYKLSIHGHRGEMDNKWLEVWKNWQPTHTKGNFHPVSTEIWLEIRPFDRTQLPEIMKNHPYFNQDMI